METVEGQESTNVEVQAEQPVNENMDVKSLMEEVSKLRATNERILSESKSHADKNRRMKLERETNERALLEEKEDYKTLNEKLKEDFNSLKKSSLKNNLDFTVAKLIDRPLQDGATVEDVIDHVLKTGLITVSDDESRFENVEDAYQKVKLEKGFLFSNKQVPMTNAVPNSGAPKERKLTQDELFLQAIKQVTKK